LLADVGADVAVADLDGDRAAAVSAEVEAKGVRSVAIPGDVLDAAGAEKVVGAAYDALGGLEVMINIVGVAGWVDLLSLDAEAWDLDIRRNLTHHLFVGQAAARRMIKDKVAGRMALVASVSGIYGAPNHAAYGAAKAGVMGLTRTMANEWGEYGIRINAVAPDVIATPRVVAGFDDRGVTDMDKIVRDDGMPLGRWGKPEEIAGPLVFLVSDLAGFMTGQTLVVDGGTQARFPHSGPKPFENETPAS
jgi:3-oxoacyl-[acyl-carrier protein] reductase